MSVKKCFPISEVAEILPAEESFIFRCVEAEWIRPADLQQLELDESDIARLRLILELKEVFGANDESIPLILHLMDQLHALYAGLPRRPI